MFLTINELDLNVCVLAAGSQLSPLGLEFEEIRRAIARAAHSRSLAVTKLQCSGVKLESEQHARADDEIAETRNRAGGEVAAFDIELDG